ncbi:MAG: hypothetical protein LUG83_05325 [Lachnospiraceae bacterium]|nr:hypothetical protein [Lachnospiraceae bacterium]
MFNTYLAIGSNDPSCSCFILENEYRPLLIDDLYYYSDYGTQKEHEVDSIILWSIHTQEIQSIVPNPNEIAELQWVSLNHISEMCDQHEEKFTSWFIPAYKKVKKVLDSIESWKMRES